MHEGISLIWWSDKLSQSLVEHSFDNGIAALGIEKILLGSGCSSEGSLKNVMKSSTSSVTNESLHGTASMKPVGELLPTMFLNLQLVTTNQICLS